MKVFISKKCSKDSPLVRFCDDHKWTLLDQSLLSFEAIEFHLKEDFDTVFFTSKRSVTFLLEKNIDLSQKRIAAIGAATKMELENRGFKVDFWSENPGLPQKVAEEFERILGKEKALFPISDRSMKSISSLLNPDQVLEIEIYKTILNPLIIDNQDIYVFTSPSNIEAFIAKNKLNPEAKYVCWGKSTEEKLNSLGTFTSKTLKTSSEEELIDVLRSINKAR